MEEAGRAVLLCLRVVCVSEPAGQPVKALAAAAGVLALRTAFRLASLERIWATCEMNWR